MHDSNSTVKFVWMWIQLAQLCIESFSFNFSVEYAFLSCQLPRVTSHFSWFFFVSEIFSATSVVRPRTDVAYCIHALARRLAKTKNWIVISFHLTFVFVSICLIVVEHVLFIDVCIWGSSGTCLKAYSKNCSSHYCLFYKTMEQGHCTSLGLLGYRGILQAS